MIADWASSRNSIVGGSEVVALLGGDDGFCTEFDLYHRKRGTAGKTPAASKAMKWGARLEGAIIEAVREDLGWNAIAWRDFDAGLLSLAKGVATVDTERGALLVHESGLGGTPDGLVIDAGPLLLETKVVSTWAWREWPEGQLPTGYLCQVWTYLGLLGLDCARVAVLRLEDTEIVTYEVQAHPAVFARLCEEAARFWRRVANNDEPPVDEVRDARTVLRRFQARTPGGSVDWSGDAERCALVESYAKARERRLAAEKFEDAKATLLRHAIGDALSIKAGRFAVNTHGNTLRVKESTR